MVTVHDWLVTGSAQLSAHGISTARLDCLVLLEDELGIDRAHLLAKPDQEIASAHVAQLQIQLDRRATHEPLAYIRGHAEFYGREFYVNEHVLVPRPESETMIELLKKVAPADSRVADIGTGSGALAITAVLEIGAVAAAVDIDEACLSVARRNAVQYTVAVTCLQGNLLQPFCDPATSFIPNILLANLPYVPVNYPVNTSAQREPALALYGGQDGLDLYRMMFSQLANLRQLPTFIMTESLPEQHASLAGVAQTADYSLLLSDDFIQVFAPA